MTPQEMQALIMELNKIEVKGEANLDVLLGCITFLKSKLYQIPKATEEGDQDG